MAIDMENIGKTIQYGIVQGKLMDRCSRILYAELCSVDLGGFSHVVFAASQL